MLDCPQEKCLSCWNEGPPIKEKVFTKLRDQNDRQIHHSKKGRGMMIYQKEMEDWENAKVSVNIIVICLGCGASSLRNRGSSSTL